MYFGIVHHDQPRQFADAVCNVHGHGKNRGGVLMLLETCAQETHLGMFRDAHFYQHGIGLYQIDKIAFVDVQNRTKEVDVVLAKEHFAVDIRQVRHEDLAFSPLLSTLFARLFYKLVPVEFPVDLEGRAAYWKRYYNTEKGKGTVGEYVLNAKRFLV